MSRGDDESSGPRRLARARSSGGSSGWRDCLAFWVACIETRLVYLQVSPRADLVARAERQQERTQPSPAKRGDILDRRGRVLATSVDADTIYAVPSAIGDAADAAKRICQALRGLRGREIVRRSPIALEPAVPSPTSAARFRPSRPVASRR